MRVSLWLVPVTFVVPLLGGIPVAAAAAAPSSWTFEGGFMVDARWDDPAFEAFAPLSCYASEPEAFFGVISGIEAPTALASSEVTIYLATIDANNEFKQIYGSFPSLQGTTPMTLETRYCGDLHAENVRVLQFDCFDGLGSLTLELDIWEFFMTFEISTYPGELSPCTSTEPVTDAVYPYCPEWIDADSLGACDEGPVCPSGVVALPGNGQVIVCGQPVDVHGNPDQDGDRAPDWSEPTLCEHENQFLESDGSCTGDDWSPPTAQSVVNDIDNVT